MYSDQDILYAMFILKANHRDWNLFHHIDDDGILFTVGALYADLFADRAECGEEFEGYCMRGYTPIGIKSTWDSMCTQKIKYRYVSEE